MLNLFSELSRSSCYTAHSFSNELRCSVIFHCYSAQSFANDYNELSHFCYSAQSFYGFVSHSRDSVTHFATVLSHFIILSTILKILLVILAQCSVILQNCSVIPEFQSFFKMTDVGSRGGRQLTTQSECSRVCKDARDRAVRAGSHGTEAGMRACARLCLAQLARSVWWTVGSRWWTFGSSP
jgi:hypothetical protein